MSQILSVGNSNGDFSRWGQLGLAVDPLAKEYLRLALLREGQAIIDAQHDREEGYLPLSLQDLQAERKKLDAL